MPAVVASVAVVAVVTAAVHASVRKSSCDLINAHWNGLRAKRTFKVN